MQQTQAAAGREYETIYVLRPTVEKASAERVSTRVEEVIGKGGGKLTGVETWGRRQLAYPVKKHKRGVYVYLKYLGGGEIVTELERNLRMLDDVLKFQTVLVRDDVDVAGLSVDPEAVKFMAIEPPADDEPEETLEQELGLAETEAPERDSGDDDSSDDDSSDDSSDEDEEEEEEED